ncbi:hypothetical protein M0G74_16875 [Microbulbifer sp. CAU 1566]|uniref:hypothetical protein n=1 Tax=Microbulbifer sp. CAU 1566 TaxID=2933269 RepID=UPI002004D693|nr:hypothetical protein [Microbulbifer sp. CAU 1566]MCK7598950.1 hypothetical protein [Microbulbifer sp. CAU 1566]
MIEKPALEPAFLCLSIATFPPRLAATARRRGGFGSAAVTVWLLLSQNWYDSIASILTLVLPDMLALPGVAMNKSNTEVSKTISPGGIYDWI